MCVVVGLAVCTGDHVLKVDYNFVHAAGWPCWCVFDSMYPFMDKGPRDLGDNCLLAREARYCPFLTTRERIGETVGTLCGLVP